MENIQTLLTAGEEAVAQATSTQELDEVRVQYLGKKGELTALLKGLGKLSPEERPQAGAKINEAKQALQVKINERKDTLEAAALETKLAAETIDVTLPGRGQELGGLHPVTKTIKFRHLISPYFLGL